MSYIKLVHMNFNESLGAPITNNVKISRFLSSLRARPGGVDCYGNQRCLIKCQRCLVANIERPINNYK